MEHLILLRVELGGRSRTASVATLPSLAVGKALPGEPAHRASWNRLRG